MRSTFVVFFCQTEDLMKKSIRVLCLTVIGILFAGGVHAHFGMVIPSDSMIMESDKRSVHLSISFSHPFEMIGMDMVKPKVFGVMVNGEKKDLLDGLRETRVMDRTAWEMEHPIRRPGVYKFYVEPTPYWEPAEDCFIIHHTQTVVAAFGDDEGWDAEIGLPTEIVPLAKPFGQYAGNAFQGIVKLNGKPVPYAEVEVEHFNQEGTARAPSDFMITHTIKADADGVFTYVAPTAGWWGFAALNAADYTLKHDGGDKDVELGAVIWVRFHDWQTR
jgi:cobalt/nickel transport protein